MVYFSSCLVDSPPNAYGCDHKVQFWSHRSKLLGSRSFEACLVLFGILYAGCCGIAAVIAFFWQLDRAAHFCSIFSFLWILKQPHHFFAEKPLFQLKLPMGFSLHLDQFSWQSWLKSLLVYLTVSWYQQNTETYIFHFFISLNTSDWHLFISFSWFIKFNYLFSLVFWPFFCFPHGSVSSKFSTALDEMSRVLSKAKNKRIDSLYTDTNY